MREIRSSGSVEGVVSNHDPYSDSEARRVVEAAYIQCAPTRGNFLQNRRPELARAKPLLELKISALRHMIRLSSYDGRLQCPPLRR
jgi:hypothetical protein